MSVSSDSNSVVKGDSAVDTVENTALVELPDLSIDSNGYYPLGSSVLKGLSVVLGNSLLVGIGSYNLGLIVLALLIGCLVRVGHLLLETVLSCVVVSEVHHTSIAPTITPLSVCTVY